jgi:hypothetical protein
MMEETMKKRCKRWQNDEKTRVGTGFTWAGGGVIPGLPWESRWGTWGRFR